RPAWNRLPSRLYFLSSRKRHTICYRDWSSDVCSSELAVSDTIIRLMLYGNRRNPASVGEKPRTFCMYCVITSNIPYAANRAAKRSEERRVGKECGARWAPRQQRTKDYACRYGRK